MVTRVGVLILKRRENRNERCRTSQPSASHFNAFAIMNVWSPQQQDLDEILSTIYDSTNSTDQTVQRSITHVSSPFIWFIHHPQIMFISFVPPPGCHNRNSTASRAPRTISPISHIYSLPSPSKKIVSGPSRATFSRIMPALSSALPNKSSHLSKLLFCMHLGILVT
jgi:hypothetical protein